MKKKRSIKAFSIAASLLMTFSLIAPNVAANSDLNSKFNQSFRDTGAISLSAKDKVSSRLLENFKDEEKVTFLIKFKEQADSEKVAAEAQQKAQSANLSAQNAKLLQRSAVLSELKVTSLESQQSVAEFLEQEQAKGNVDEFESFFIVNGMAVTATKEIAEKVATFAEVEKVLPNEMRQLNATKTANTEQPQAEIANVEWNISRVKAPEVWGMGIDGSGSVVASIDTGVQWDHPALKEKYRGYNKATGQVSHDFNWYDATSAGRAAPYDDLEHGTHVTGTMVGGEPNGSNQIGVAPGAKFIAVKAFTASGGSDADLIRAAQWIAAPRDAAGNERADLAPDVVNNSWSGGPGIDDWYRPMVINWRALQIFPEFSAGNTTLSNPGGPGSVANPANYPESFATGATDINDRVASFSLRGPSPYGGIIKPDIIAPGVNIRSSIPGSGYEGGWNGTSMAGPAVSGVVALLRQVNASLTVDQIEEILKNTAVPLTDSQYPTTPNHGYGYGLVDAYAAVTSIASGLGTLKGQVTIQGDDNEAPTFNHVAPRETYAGLDLALNISVSDNISVSSVVFNYLDANGDYQQIQAGRLSGDYKAGEYGVVVPGNLITGNAFTYFFTINDFGNNEVNSEVYTIEVKPGITTGYFENFESAAHPAGWYSFGNQNSWQWGKPTSGPGNAASGEKVYATNLSGLYSNSMNATLVMPPVDLPEGNSYLHFKQWYNFEMSTSGTMWDYGRVMISTDLVNWTQLSKTSGLSNTWIDGEVDLSAYAGQRVYIGFNAFSDGSVQRDGWYIDDVALTNAPQPTKLGVAKDNSKNSIAPESKLEKEKYQTQKPVDPDTVKVALPEKSVPPVVEGVKSPTLLPLGAQVSVLESGRSVYTNPADGSYSMTHNAGTFTAKAEAYGYASQVQTINIEADGVATANFTLEALPQNTVSGVVTDAATGEGIGGATLLLVEDANIQPVETDANGNYSITGYEGDYTLKVIARGYHGSEVAVSIDADGDVKNIALQPFYTYPGGEIGYDDGTAENARAWNAAGNAWAVKMSLPQGKENGIVTDGVFRFWDTEWPVPGGTAFQVEVYAAGADGLPAGKLAGPIDATAKRDGSWTVVDLREYSITVNGDFYMVYRQNFANPNTPGLATDESSTNAKRSYQQISGEWSASPADEGNYMIRARVDYEVVAPVITSPAANFTTNVAAQTVEGAASPTATIKLKHNGGDAGSVVVGNDGKFSFPVTLTEGANEFSVVSIVGGRATGESAPVTAILDTMKPELAITSPKDGSKTNRETVTVEGTVADANLDWVRVNGQDAPVVNGKFSKRVILDNGANEITVVARDKANNRITKKVTVHADFDAPVISNLTPASDLYLTTGKSVKIEFDSEPGLRGTFVIHMPLTNLGGQVQNATELPMMEMANGKYVGYWTVPFGTVASGAQIEVKAVDSFGNETRQLAAGKLYLNVAAPSAQPSEEKTAEEPAKEEEAPAEAPAE